VTRERWCKIDRHKNVTPICEKAGRNAGRTEKEAASLTLHDKRELQWKKTGSNHRGKVQGKSEERQETNPKEKKKKEKPNHYTRIKKTREDPF